MSKNLSSEEKARYLESWKQPGAIKAMLQWYRALVKNLSQKQLIGEPIHVPTLILWGKKDKYLQADLAQFSLKHCTKGQVYLFDQGYSSVWFMLMRCLL